MKEKLLLVGSGGFGRVTLEYALKTFDCYFVDDGYVIGNEICGAQVVGHISDLLNLFSDYKHLVVTIGNNAFREKIYKEAEKIAEELGSDTVYNWVHPNNDKIINFLKRKGYDVLNLIEVRKPRPGEQNKHKIKVDKHEFNY
jgi:hypothetical protein